MQEIKERAKGIVAKYLRERHTSEGYTGFTIQTEVQYPEAGLVADVLVTFGRGNRFAQEIYFDAISPEELKERERLYSNLGMDLSYWICEGSPADTEENREFLLEEFGECNVFAKNGDLSCQTTSVELRSSTENSGA
jgi:hypothetical protein